MKPSRSVDVPLRRIARVYSGKSPPLGFAKDEGKFGVYGSNGLIGFSPDYLRTRQTLIVGRVGACGAVNVAPSHSWISDNALIIDLGPRASLQFVRYTLSVVDYTPLISTTAQPLLTGADVSTIPIWIPPLPEQKQIALFLDHETAKMDALIEKQQQLIALLQEKRQAVISHAVTKGLPAAAVAEEGLPACAADKPLRDSGVEWLGEVPAHWKVKRIKNLAECISKGTTPSTIGMGMTDAGIRFIKGENVGKGLAVSKSPEFFISEDTDQLLERSRLKRGDVLVIIAGATTGLCSVVEADLLPANTNQAVSFVRPFSLGHSQLITRWLSTEFAQRMIWMGAVQAAQPNLSMEDLGNIPIAVPPADELERILIEVSALIERLDQLIEQVGAMSDLLQERRTALISAAVTGKIDVRSWKPPKAEPHAEIA